MQSSEFVDIFNNFPNVKNLYSGCYSRDNLPKSLKTRSFIVVNTDFSFSPGLHWYTIYKPECSKIEVFDSIGIDEAKKTFLKNNCKFRGIYEIEFNTTKFQSDSSNTCGKFVLYFIFERLHNQDLSFKKLLEEIFVENCTENEQKVVSFYETILK